VPGTPVPRVTIVAHADWSKSPKKRWVAIARRRDATFVIDAAQAVGPAEDFLPRLHENACGGAVLAGFDFPIGLPAAYAAAAGIRHFDDLLRQLGAGPWADFCEPARDRSEIVLTRPFYPARSGGTRQSHLLEALGVPSMDDLRRRCERATSTRRAACSLFWTLGANQVGRAAVSGWREVIAPALAAKTPRTALWPFHGPLPLLLDTHDCVLAETYPTQAYAHIGLGAAGTRWSKRHPVHRTSKGQVMQSWAAKHGIELSPQLHRQLADGFGTGADGEDAFDAVAGVLSMVAVVLGFRPDGAPDIEVVRNVEGWIFGQPDEANA
jgi:hypothetical protein